MPASGLREAVMADATVARSYPFGPIHGLEIDPMYFWLQEHEPLARVKLPYGEEGWLLTRYDDVRTALGDARFSLAEAAVRDVPRLTPQRYGGILTDQDPPEHTRLRRLVAKAFTARRVEQLRGRAEQITGDLLDEMVKAGPPADLAQALAVPLPGLMICELIGVPYADRRPARRARDRPGGGRPAHRGRGGPADPGDPCGRVRVHGQPDRQLHVCPADPPRPARPAALPTRPDARRRRGADALGTAARGRRCPTPVRPGRRRAQRRHGTGRRAGPARQACRQPRPAQVRRPRPPRHHP